MEGKDCLVGNAGIENEGHYALQIMGRAEDGVGGVQGVTLFIHVCLCSAHEIRLPASRDSPCRLFNVL